MSQTKNATAELERLAEDIRREKNWKRWGPYLSERQWGTVREDYSPEGSAWEYFTHEHARSRAYRWGEDGLLGICDRQGRLNFALALWNGRDPILKERLFGLTSHEGNHGEDVKECYYYLDSTPTHSYMKALYRYPQAEYPYARLVQENRARGKQDREFELVDTGVFDEDRYFDVTVEYGKSSPEDLLIRITIANRGPDAASISVLPTLWFRNTWSWGLRGEEGGPKPLMRRIVEGVVATEHHSIESYHLFAGTGPDGELPELLFTDNETNSVKLFAAPNTSSHVKDAFHDYVVHGRTEAVNPALRGTKAAALYRMKIPPGSIETLRLRLCLAAEAPSQAFGRSFDAVFEERIAEAGDFYAARIPKHCSDAERAVSRSAYAGLLWSKQFYHYVVEYWIDGDPAQPPPPPERRSGRQHEWRHIYNRDVLSMPDKWEYPWYAAWDLAFHMIPFSRIDPDFAKQQLELFLREWYMHPNGQIPAYEWEFSDVNPPVHAWACWRVYKRSGVHGGRDRRFLASAFQKLLLNFTWWVNRKDHTGKHIFSGGFLGLDNIGVFDRSKPLPTGGWLDQADGTAWMAFYCGTMLSMAFELAKEDRAYEDMASKFFEHFIAIVDAMNQLGGSGLWSEEDGFYYDQIRLEGETIPMRVRSMVGLIPLLAVEILEQETIDRLPGFKKRMEWFLNHRQDLAKHIGYMEKRDLGHAGHRLLAIPSRARLERVLRYVLDEHEFLSPFGIRALSRFHAEHPFILRVDGVEHRVDYVPGEATTALFGGNSNWRGPIWFPVNFLLIEALERYYHYYGDSLQVEFPTGSGRRMNLQDVARELASRLVKLFLPDANGRRPCHGDDPRYRDDPHWREFVLFHEYFHGEDGRGLGASHQTGWTGLVATLMESVTCAPSSSRESLRRTPVARGRA